MIRSTAALGLAALFASGAWAAGGGGGYYVTIVPAAQPGNACIADGVGSGQETRTSDGTLVLATQVHGAISARCPNPAFPNLATTQKLATDEVRNAPSVQCVATTAQVGDEVVIPFYGRATVLQLHASNTQCNLRRGSPEVEATVISTAAHRAAKAAQAPGNSAPPPPPAAAREPTEADIRQEYDRVVAAAAPVREFQVRHILVRTREDADLALSRIRSGKPFAEVAAEVSIDPGSRAKGGDLGWHVPAHFIEEFSKTMVSLAPSGLAQEPTRTKFGWHVIEVLAVKLGKDSFPPYAAVKDRIAAKLRSAPVATVRVAAKAVCRKMVAPEPPAAALREGIKGTVVAEMRVETGKVAEILSLTGPSAYHPAVTDALNRYECDRLDRTVIATQSFEF